MLPTDADGILVTDIQDVADSILDSADSIWSFDNITREWSAFFPGDPLASDLEKR